jgi:hypothetical protein
MLLLIVVVVVVMASIDWILGPSLGPVEWEEGCRRARQRAECGRDRTREDYLIFHLCDP